MPRQVNRSAESNRTLKSSAKTSPVRRPERSHSNFLPFLEYARGSARRHLLVRSFRCNHGLSFVRCLMHEAGFSRVHTLVRASSRRGSSLSRLHPIQSQLNSRFRPLWVSGKDYRSVEVSVRAASASKRGTRSSSSGGCNGKRAGKYSGGDGGRRFASLNRWARL